MIRILYLTDSLEAGGTEQQLVQLIGMLDRRRFQPFVLCLYGPNVGRSQHYEPKLRALDVPVVIIDQKAKPRLMAEIIRHVWEVRPDLIQAANYHSNLLVRMVRPLLPLNVRLIACIYVEYTNKQLFYECLSLWLCSAVICNSPYIAEQLKHVLPKRRVDVIANGIDFERFSPSQKCQNQLKDQVPPDAECILLFMGRISRQKAVHLIVDALGLLQKQGLLPHGIYFWIVGEQSEPQAQRELAASITRCGLEAIVRQMPATDHPELFYQLANVVVLPSLWEGLPSVILESWATGLPVIVSEAANRASLVRHGVNGWVVGTGDVEHLSQALADAICQRDTRQTMAEECRRSVLPFSVGKMVAAYTALYERVSARV